MKRKKKIFVLTIFPLFFGVFNYLPAKATSNDAITLESISAVSTTVLTGQNIVLNLELNIPTSLNWNPINGLDGSQLPLTVLSCLKNNWNGTRCTSGSKSFTADNYTSQNLYLTRNVMIAPIKNLIPVGEYLIYKVVVQQPTIYEDSHTYNRNFTYAIDSWGDMTAILVPTLINADFSVVSSLPTPTLAPTPTPTVSVTPTPSPTPTVTETATPTPTPSVSETIPVSISITTSNSSRSESSNSNRSNAEVSIPLAIQTAGKAILQTPSRNGDLTWKKAEDIYVKNINWETKINKNANNGNFIQTNSNESPIVIFTSGDAFTLRFLTGKTRGNIQINVDGKKLANFKTSAKKSSFKAKSWIGIGPGKHKIEIIPILKSGESIGLDAIHVARAV